MIRTPISPIIHEQLTHILCRHFDAQPVQGAKLATRLIKTLREYDLDIIRGNWMDQPPTEAAPAKTGGITWESLAQLADALVEERNGIAPWRPPELQ